MSSGNSHLFRKASLDKLASPERLDQLMQAVSLRHWIPLASLGTMVVIALGWSVIGRIPVIATGRGAFVDATDSLGARAVIKDVVAPASGTVADLVASRGDHVEKGDLIGLIDQPELTQALAVARTRLKELKSRQQSLAPVVSQRSKLSKSSLASQRAEFKESLRNAEALTPILRSRGEQTMVATRKATELSLRNADKQVANLKLELENRKLLRDKGLITLAMYAAVESDYLRATEQVASLRVRLLELNNREAESRKAYLANLSEIAALRTRLKDLDVRARSGDLDDMSSSLTAKGEVTEAERQVSNLEKQLQGATEVLADSSGRILEISVTEGQVINRGGRLGRIVPDSEEANFQLASVAYFTIGDGMRIKPGMKVQITPDTVKREEFGGIIGTVTRVSEFPITASGAISVVNSEQIAQDLTANSRTIELFTKLEEDKTTTSGYKWSSSRGPALKVSIGTTNNVRVTIEEVAPITFLLPFLKPWLGGGTPEGKAAYLPSFGLLLGGQS